MKQQVLFILLNEYADWEGAFLASALNAGVMPGSDAKYVCKVVAPTMDPVISIGGFRTLPDYTFQTLPNDYAALVLVGGMQWNSMAAHGFLNDVKHTGNTLDQLKLWGKGNYKNENGYVERQAVSDKRIITANGSGYVEFCREMLQLLQADTEENIASSYNFNKFGLYKE